MKESTSKEKILKKIRDALIDKSNNPYPNIDFESSVYKDITESLDVTFVQEFLKVSGDFIFCEDENELISNLKVLISEKNISNLFCLEHKIKDILTTAQIQFYSDKKDFYKADAGITLCEYLIARFGSIMVSSKQVSGRKLMIYPSVHIVIAYTSQIVPDLKDALIKIKNKYDKLPSAISVITGPSKTAEIENTLVKGGYGPKKLYLFLVDDYLQDQKIYTTER